MKKLITFAAFAAILTSLSACSLFSVQSELKDKDAFVQANTYAWRSKAIPKSSSSDSKPYKVDQKIRTSVNDVMSEKGYQLVESDADLYLDYRYKIAPMVVAEQPEVSEASISISRDSGITRQNANVGTSQISYSARFTLTVFKEDKKTTAYDVSFKSDDIQHDSQKDIDKHISDLTRRMKRTIPAK
ncbi:hypothetical protein ACFOEK_20840 [Litoribrevibacter euphylliae]|uniref:DUF4136 domain-containing protein n=1 Tax=Litoribrevibacter euphylliae TaxID=1834034 RepID=A0ABV7HHZ7_9GAMM